MEQNNYTDFGFEKVSEKEKTAKVKDIFSSVAKKYDLMNDVMSLGVHRLWKKSAIAQCNLKHGQTVLDLAGGTGDLAAKISKIIGEKGKIILSDINNSMLSEGRNRLINQGIIKNIEYVQANAEALPFLDNCFDVITIAFGLRNVTNKNNALSEMYRILKPGGKLVILEFSHPDNEGLKKLYDLYSFNIIPKLGELIANDSKSYQYLVESIRMHPNQEKLKQMILNAKFDECKYINLTGGIATIHKAFKY